MALSKNTVVAGVFAASYWTIDRFRFVDELRRQAEFIVNLYADSDHTSQAARTEAAVVTVRAEAFDAYLSKAALSASTSDIYGQAYQLLIDATAAFIAKRDGQDSPHATLAKIGQVDIASDYGNSFAFEGAKPA